jgi:hypothetical protein
MELRYGADVSFQYNYSESDYNINNTYFKKSTIYQPGINIVFGVNYLIGENFVIGAEVLPIFSLLRGERIEINDGTENKRDITGYNYGLSNTSALISLSYRFE